MYKSLTRIKPADVAVVTLQEAKDHLRVDSIDEDDYIQGLLDAAVAHLDGCDGVLGWDFAPQTWEVVFDGPVEDLPLGPVIEQKPPVVDGSETTIRFTIGPEDGVPAGIKQAILLLIGNWYLSREAVVIGISAEKLPLAVEMLLTPHRRWV